MTYLLHHLLDRTAAMAPDAEALVHGETRLSYSQMLDHTLALATRLRALGANRRDRVGVWLDKSTEEAMAFFAISRADGVFVPINTLLVERQVEHVLRDCGVRFLITDAARLGSSREMLSMLEDLEAVLLIDGDETGRRETALMTVSDVFARVSATAPPEPIAVGEDLAAILYTSGSTGHPKGVMLSHRNLIAGSRIVAEYLAIRPDERILSVLPFSFDVGLNQLVTAVDKAATLVLLRFTFGEQIVREIERERCTALAGVPTIWAILTGSSPSFKKRRLDSVRYFTNTGGPVPSTTLARIRAAQPHVDFYLMYGLTEAFRSTYLPPSEVDRRPTSIGKAIPETEIFLVNDEGAPCRPGETGILVHHGPTVSLGYWNRPEDTARVLRPHPFVSSDQGGVRVCYSGDRVRQDEEGYFYFVGRSDAMIKSSGYRISPSEVEEVLVASGCVSQAAVIGLPDASIGERVHAICVPLGGGGANADTVLEFCAGELPRHMLPRAIEFVPELPRSPNGKVDYKRLKSERLRDS